MEAAQNSRLSLGVLLLLLTLTACGGGGGGYGGAGGGGQTTASVPTITQQPVTMSIGAGSSATFTIAATGNGTLTYQWHVLILGPCPLPICGAISGATGPTLTLAANASTAAAYVCIVTNTLNGTQQTATSAAASLNVTQPTFNATITATGVVLPNTAGLVASVPQQTGVTYTWSISNGTITAGQATRQITYTSGALGQLQLIATLASQTGGVVAGVKNVEVVSKLPIVSVFAQSSVLPGTSGVMASTPGVGQTYAWTATSGTTPATITGSSTSDTLTYSVGGTPGSYQLSVNVTDQAGNNGSATQTLSVVQGTFFKDVRDMAQRSLHTATLLNDGRVLVAGGDAGIPGFQNQLPLVSAQSNIVGTAELFDPVTATWAMVGSLSTARFEHTATRLNDGRVMVAGGADGTGTALASTEIYDPATRSWNPGPPMSTARALPSATLLADGRVLVAGGVNASGTLASAEIYDPVANSWGFAGTMSVGRVEHSATRLGDGRVLAAGGLPGPSNSADLYNPATNSWQSAATMLESEYAEGAVLLASGKVLQLGNNAEIYDPASNSWQLSAPPYLDQGSPEPAGGVSATTAILLPNGQVFAAGGYFDGFGAAIYDPVMQSWTDVPLTPASGSAPSGVAGPYGSVTALQDDRVLAVGGVSVDLLSAGTSLSVTALYDPTQNSWSVSGSRAHFGGYAASAVLANGQVLVTGGNVPNNGYVGAELSNADLFNPASNSWTPAAVMSTGRQQHTATVLQSGKVLVTGGIYQDVLASAEVYDPIANTWTSTGAMSSARYQHTASVLGNGLVLVAGGNNMLGPCSCTTFVSSAELYNPATNSFAPTSSLLTARSAHTATVLANGKVLVAGGFGGPTSTLQSGGAPLASAELYDPATGMWTATGSMTTARTNHTAILLPSTKVLVAGGSTGASTTATTEIYDPLSGKWTAAASMSTPRQSHQAVTLANGRVLIVGGLNDASSAVIGIGTAEVFDPTANTWTISGGMMTTRQFFVLNALNDGRILLEGGTPNASGLPEFYK